MSDKKEWYRNWFDSPYYDILYKDRDQEEADMFIYNLVKYLAPKKNALMLDLACGNGRYSIALNRMDYNVTGIDLSQKKIEAAKHFQNNTLAFAVNDMRMPLEPNKYDYVFNLFTSFGYFDKEEENKIVLANVYNSLKKGGIFVLDYVNGEKAVKYLMPHEEYTIEGVHFDIKKFVKGNLIVKEINIKDGDDECSFSEKVSIFSESKLKGYITGCGFEISQIFGDYQLKGFDAANSDRLIIISRKI
jgi:SAM-dependent methyltransferase